MPQRKKILEPQDCRGYSFFRSTVSMAIESTETTHHPWQLFLHQVGANHKAGARAPGFFVRVRFVFRPPGPIRVILRVV
jgi:hypothetical protein